MTKIRSMFTLICCSLAGLKMSLRTGFCCRNVLVQDKIKAHRKLYLSLPHIGILGVPSPNCMLHLQFWDGALLPPAVLGWHLLTCKLHLLTCKFLTCSIGMAPSHLQFFFLADFSHAVLEWHRPGLPNSPQKKQSMESWRFCHNVYTSPVDNAKITENKNDHSVKNAKVNKNKNDQWNHATNLS